MSLSAGIIGLPNVGKSTLFNALCAGKAAAENYPFCTIDPNHGVAAVPDERLGRIAAHITTQKVVPAFLELIDIAGLVKGASTGAGLGNQFLGHIKDADAVVQVVRCFESGDVVHVDGSVDPLRDVSTLETELLLKDLETAENGVARVAKIAKSGEKDDQEKLAAFKKVRDALGRGTPARAVQLDGEERSAVAEMHLITAKPMLYAANVDEAGLAPGAASPHLAALRGHAEKQGAACVPICAKIEAELNDLPENERLEFLASLGLNESGLSALSRAVYKLLGLISFFTFNEKELRAWNLREGSTASQAAGTIHSDFEKGFVKADVYTVEELERYTSEHALRTAGRIRSEGREYVVKDGEILFFRFTA
ncbi:MAG: redox-regulated ATPase YchF [Chitinispirillaceae bacterium]|nr:redox-regulated ATPase YchF [Chitinispirillaceae bacterium]